MRSIKFRAWNKEKNIMVYEDEDGSSEYFDGVCLSDIQMVNSIFKTDFNQYEWMQYTGLKYKNGKEIYEGDILKVYDDFFKEGLDDLYGVVKFNNGRFYLDTFKSYPNECWVYFEVVGNIYENPELIEELLNEI